MKNTINLIKMDLELMPTWVALIFLAISGMLMLIPVFPRFLSPFYMLLFLLQHFLFPEAAFLNQLMQTVFLSLSLILPKAQPFTAQGFFPAV